jgi:hypothetical protein
MYYPVAWSRRARACWYCDSFKKNNKEAEFRPAVQDVAKCAGDDETVEALFFLMSWSGSAVVCE